MYKKLENYNSSELHIIYQSVKEEIQAAVNRTDREEIEGFSLSIDQIPGYVDEFDVSVDFCFDPYKSYAFCLVEDYSFLNEELANDLYELKDNAIKYVADMTLAIDYHNQNEAA